MVYIGGKKYFHGQLYLEQKICLDKKTWEKIEAKYYWDKDKGKN